MTDEKYVFFQDSKEKKITARSARNARTHNGKRGSVKLPSDYLTGKELKAMNGEVKTYRLNEPMSWDEFKAMPDDIKVQYITAIRERFSAPEKYIAEMFGISAHTLQLYCADLGCSVGKGSGNKKWEKEKFLAWRTGADENAVIELQETKDAEIKDNECDCPIIPASGCLNFDCPADQALNVIHSLLNNAKVRLKVEWEVVE